MKCILIDSYKHSLQIGRTITLIRKGKDLPREKLASWRPITLLNTDQKILAKVRLNKVITKRIPNDQSGFIKGRTIAIILRTTSSITYTRSNCQDVLQLQTLLKHLTVFRNVCFRQFEIIQFWLRFLQTGTHFTFAGRQLYKPLWVDL